MPQPMTLAEELLVAALRVYDDATGNPTDEFGRCFWCDTRGVHATNFSWVRFSVLCQRWMDELATIRAERLDVARAQAELNRLRGAHP